jgi:hypothetical protein
MEAPHQHVRGHAGIPAAGWQQLKGPGCRSRASYGCRRHPGCTPAEPQLSSTWLLLAPPTCLSTTPTPGIHVRGHVVTLPAAGLRAYAAAFRPKRCPAHPALAAARPQDQCSGCFTAACLPATKCPQAGAGQGRHTGELSHRLQACPVARQMREAARDAARGYLLAAGCSQAAARLLGVMSSLKMMGGSEGGPGTQHGWWGHR